METNFPAGRSFPPLRHPASAFLVYAAFLLFAAFSSAAAFAGQTITVDGGAVNHSVYGNGAPPDGAWTEGGPIALKSPDNNTVIVNNAAITSVGGGESYYVYGGYRDVYFGAGTVSGNSVTISGSTVDSVRGGTVNGRTDTATAADNHVSLINSDVGSATAGVAWNGNNPVVVKGNCISVSGGTTGYVQGASAWALGADATAVNNSVRISSGAVVTQTVIGGDAAAFASPGAATVLNNKVFINDSTIGGAKGAYIDGGYATASDGLASARDNSVYISDSTIMVTDGEIAVYGGEALSGSGDATALSNSVAVSDGSVVGDSNYKTFIYGGYAESESGLGRATAASNSVSISNSAVTGLGTSGSYGGYAKSDSGPATATGNKVTVHDSEVKYVYGGYAESRSGPVTATGNHVSLTNSTVESATAGTAWTRGDKAVAADNSFSVSGGSIEYVRGGLAWGWEGAATASGNSAWILPGSVVTRTIVGGSADAWYSGSATASNNKVFIYDSTIGGAKGAYIYGGNAYAFDGLASARDNGVYIFSGTVAAIGEKITVFGGRAMGIYGDAATVGNSVVIYGGSTGDSTKRALICGGYTEAGIDPDEDTDTVAGTGTGTATGNSVAVSGGTIDGDIYGGYVSLAQDAAGSATRNSVTISGAPALTAAALHGGFVWRADAPAAGMDAFTGNALNVWNYEGSSVAGLDNFEFINFTFPTAWFGTASSPMLEVDGTARLHENGGEDRRSVITVNTPGGTAPLEIGTGATLLAAANLDDARFVNATAYGLHGATLRYIWSLEITDDAITAVLAGIEGEPRAKAMSEGFLAGAALVNQGGDLVAGQGLAQAVSAAAQSAAGFGAFGALAGGWSRYNTGSHVDMSSFSLLAGLAYGAELDPGRLTVGAFFEYGNGSYDTRNSFSTAASVHGDGDIYHAGGGLLGRLDFSGSGSGRFYAEGSLRAGRLHNEYGSSDLRDSLNRKTEYDSSSIYYGLHLGAGYVRNLTDAVALDIYGKYFWTRQEGDSVSLASGDKVRFEDADSRRLRAGGRLSYAVSDQFSPYFGAAYEHEFDGKVKAASYGYAIDAPDLKGGTGIGELGFTVTPSQTLPLSFDLGVQGYAGRREGVTGSLQAMFKF